MFGVLTEGLRKVFQRLASRGLLDQGTLRATLRDMRVVLLEADVSLPVARQFLSHIEERAAGMQLPRGASPADVVARLVHAELVDLLDSGETPAFPREAPTAIMLAGLHGCGKTTTCVKLCRLLQKAGKEPVLLAADTRRAAASEQLRQFADPVGVEVVVFPGLDPLAVAERGAGLLQGRPSRVVVADTGGRLHVDEELMTELEAIEQVLKPSDTFLVADAMTGQDAVRIAKEFRRRIGLTGVILTKMDGDARGGAALTMKEATGTPVRFVGVGEKPDDLEAFHPVRVATRILGMGDLAALAERASDEVDEREAARVGRALATGSFDLNDMLLQLRRLRRMGPLESIMALVPGSQMIADTEGTDGLRHAEAIICSMTSEERRRPDIIDGSRRRRIARGSGTSVQEVNQLLRQFGMFRKVLKKAGKKGLRSLIGATH
jgi:signal recognition particle subunit SRP54